MPHVFFWLLLCWTWRLFTDSIGWLILVPRLNLLGLSTIFTRTAVQNWNSWSRYWQSKSRALVLQDLKLLVLFLSTFTVVSQCVQTYLLYYSRIQMVHHNLCPHCMQPCSCFLSSDTVSYASKYFCASSIRYYMILLRWRISRIPWVRYVFQVLLRSAVCPSILTTTLTGFITDKMGLKSHCWLVKKADK